VVPLGWERRAFVARGNPRSRSDANEHLNQRARTRVGCADAGHGWFRPREHLRADGVVLELSMPDLDGVEVAQRMHASDREQATSVAAPGGLVATGG